jgi:hypothetical protein
MGGVVLGIFILGPNVKVTPEVQVKISMAQSACLKRQKKMLLSSNSSEGGDIR